MVVCSKAMINLARGLEERYGIPYFEGSFYGIGDTSDSLRKLAALLVKRGADHSLIERTEELIVEEEAIAFRKIASYAERLRGKRLLLITGGVKSWSVVSALSEIGINVIGSSAKKSTEGDKEKIQKLLGEESKMYEELSQREMHNILRKERVDIMLSGGRTQFVALKAKVPWLDINQERHHAYAGYDGMVNLVRQIDLAVSSPIWERVRKRAPWESNEN
jgi:nitrogenase molybdenum-cofactor synthesis protein NifE